MTVRVGIRELQHNASRVIDRVKAGETIEITERGRLVAVLGPPPLVNEAREAMIANGTLRPGRGGLAGWRPKPAQAGLPTLSAVLAEMRDEDDR